MKGLVDPVKNAKTVGIIILIGVVLKFLPAYLGIKLAIAMGGLTLPLIIMILVSFLVPLVLAIGLIMHKKWAIYMLGVMGLLLLGFYLKDTGDREAIIFAIVYGVLFFWFWMARDRFGKVGVVAEQKEKIKL